MTNPSGPFSLLDGFDPFCTYGLWCVSSSPDWLQATEVVVLAVLLSLVLFVAMAVFKVKDRHQVLINISYGLLLPPLVGVDAGLASLVYGVQNESLGFALGGITVLAIALIILLVLLGALKLWLPGLCLTVGLSLIYFGAYYGSQAIEIGGGIVLAVGVLRLMVVMRQRESLF